ncbi:MAG: cob(I)yrinic acid a,c-diamide adenosyltransferase, partial [Phycisphaerales bacterium]|nr:cob(I)yrinic acid a,c-diamide adenosyltransferase [Phycisphaerales bacterium]
MKIYTKQGDTGKTMLFNGTRVEKDDLRIEMYGTVDELNSTIGLAVAECADEKLKEILAELQRQLLDLGADGTRTWADAVTWMEEQINAATVELPVLKRLIVPGGGVTASRLHVARTVCRRAERIMVRLT